MAKSAKGEAMFERLKRFLAAGTIARMNRQIDHLIQRQAWHRMQTMFVECEIDGLIRERNALADRHGLKAHPKAPDRPADR